MIDESWRENDGLVNTVSAGAPAGAPCVPYEPGHAEPGIWQVMPVFHGDHMSLQGGIMKRKNIRPVYLELVRMIDELAAGREREKEADTGETDRMSKERT